LLLLLLLIVLTIIALALPAWLVLSASAVAGLVAVMTVCALAHLLLPLVMLVGAALLGSFLVFLVLFVVEGAMSALVIFALLVPAKSIFKVLVNVRFRKLLDVLLRAGVVSCSPILGYFQEQLNKAVGIKCRVMLLAKPERALFPVRHLLALADYSFKQLLSHFTKALLLGQEHLFVVILEVNKVGKIFEKLHARKIPA
jgi:hypothetical protein